MNPAAEPVQVVVLVCCFNNRADLDDCLGSIVAGAGQGIDCRIVVVDNASTDGSAEHVQSRFPSVDLLRLDANMGFAGGNNAGYELVRSRYPRARYLMLLNADTKVAPGAIAALVEHLDRSPDVAAAQAKLILFDEPDRINTIGDRSHFLGFGFMLGYREVDRGQYDQPFSIDYASGAAMLVRTSALEQVGLFDPDFFMYLEDAELGWKLRQIGLDIHTVPAALVYHKYTSSAPVRFYYHLERNRWLLLLTYYRWPTLLLVAPALLLMELGQLVYALSIGKVGDKLRTYAFFLRPSHLASLRRKRRQAQQRRTVSDRAFLSRFAGTIEYEGVDHPLLRYVGNPVLGLYWAIARRLICW